MKVKLISLKTGKATESTVDLKQDIWQQKFNQALVNQAMRVYQFNSYQGTRAAKTRGQVSRPDKKPWRQKGTGRARHGSKNSPLWVGGGVTFAPQSFQKRLKLNKNMKKEVLKSLLSLLLKEDRLLVVDVSKTTEADLKVKNGKDFLKRSKLNYSKTAVVLGKGEKNIKRIFNNIPKVTVREVVLLNGLDLAGYDKYVFTKQAIKDLESRLSSQEKDHVK